MSILVSILSILVTILIGWQIINSIGINGKLREYEKASNKSAKNEIERYSHSVRSYVFSLMTLDLYRRNITEYAIDNFVKAIDEGLKGTDIDAINIAVSHLELIMKENKGYVTILNGKRKEYISILSNVNDERIDGIIEKIIKAAELPSLREYEDEIKA